MHSNGTLGLGAGPAGDVLSIIETLKDEGVFAREVDTLGLAFHSPALDPLLPELTQGRPLGVIGSFNPLAVQCCKTIDTSKDPMVPKCLITCAG